MKNGFAGRVPMGLIAGKYEIPWPEWMTLFGFVLQKDYRMNAFPETSDGRPWYDIPDEEYFSWLAEYLPANIPELTPEQQKLRDDPEGYKVLNGLRIGDTGGLYEQEMMRYPMYEFPEDFGKTADFSVVRKVENAIFSYEEYHEMVVENDFPEEPLLSREEFLLEVYGCQRICEEEETQFASFWPEFSKLGAFDVVFKMNTLASEPPDAGWRTLLALALEKIPDRGARITELEAFYRFWQEMISK
ncbi:MAG: hypothetical protein WC124_05290 [Desulfoplanes sp.]